MKITKTDERLIDEGYRYKIEGDLISDKEIDLMDLDKPIYVTGCIDVMGSIKASESIKACGSIWADGYIKACGSIEAGGSIWADGHIEAGMFIYAGRSIKAGGYIEAGRSYGIFAGLYIKAKTTISAGINILTGKDQIVTCTKLLGGATVEYGILNIVENEPDEVNTDNLEDIITLNGKKYKLIKD